MTSLGAGAYSNPEANGVHNAITPQALCVVNAVYDRRLYHARSRTESADHVCLFPRGEAANFSARRHELAFTTAAVRKLGTVGGQMSSTQNDVPLLTSFNGLAIAKKDVDHFVQQIAKTGDDDVIEELYRLIRSKVRFIGVNLQTIDAANANRSDVMACVIAGMFTVINTGPTRLNIMEKVVWDVPRIAMDRRLVNGSSSAGGGGSKSLAQIKSYNSCVREVIEMTPRRVGTALDAAGDDHYNIVTLERSLGDELVNIIASALVNNDASKVRQDLSRALLNNGGKNKTAQAFKRFIEGVRHLTDEVDSRVIGTATHSAQPGAQADILIRHAV
jgi:hypothetical protein